ncbi:OmpA family protein [Nonomuraea sp. NPDC050022]|uniref:OmpA family protein n=1 Tax=unclassified Nonomuraea TaxID=2593643 RepID=UPI003410494D
MREVWRTAVVVALLVGVVGCADRRPVSNGCSWITTPADGDTGEVTSKQIALVDLSGSFWPEQGKSVSQPVDPVGEITEQLAADYTENGIRLVSLAGFDGSSTTIVQRLNDVKLPVPTGSNPEHGRRAVRDCLKKEVEALLAERPQVPGSDPMAALASAGSQRGDTPANRTHVLVVTDGLGNTGCLDLRKVTAGRSNAADLVASCKNKKDLAKLKGLKIKIKGIGLQVGQPPLKTSEHAWLNSFWEEVCAHLGTECALEQAQSAKRGSTVQRPDDPVIKFPNFDCNPCVLPEKFLFAFGSDELTPSASGYLDILIERLGTRKVVSVVGHTDSIGGDAYNRDLSKRRAEAVKARLGDVAAGARVDGAGSSQPKCTHEYNDGKPDKSCMAQNRRVEITLGSG